MSLVDLHVTRNECFSTFPETFLAVDPERHHVQIVLLEHTRQMMGVGRARFARLAINVPPLFSLLLFAMLESIGILVPRFPYFVSFPLSHQMLF